MDKYNTQDMTDKQLVALWNDIAFWADMRKQVKVLTSDHDHSGILYSNGCTNNL